MHLWLNARSQRRGKVTEVCFQLRTHKYFPLASADSICAHLINTKKKRKNAEEFYKEQEKSLKGNDAFQRGGTAARAGRTPPELCFVFGLWKGFCIHVDFIDLNREEQSFDHVSLRKRSFCYCLFFLLLPWRGDIMMEKQIKLECSRLIWSLSRFPAGTM